MDMTELLSSGFSVRGFREFASLRVPQSGTFCMTIWLSKMDLACDTPPLDAKMLVMGLAAPVRIIEERFRVSHQRR
jgi:hypothetical protein